MSNNIIVDQPAYWRIMVSSINDGSLESAMPIFKSLQMIFVLDCLCSGVIDFCPT